MMANQRNPQDRTPRGPSVKSRTPAIQRTGRWLKGWDNHSLTPCETVSRARAREGERQCESPLSRRMESPGLPNISNPPGRGQSADGPVVPRPRPGCTLSRRRLPAPAAPFPGARRGRALTRYAFPWARRWLAGPRDEAILRSRGRDRPR